MFRIATFNVENLGHQADKRNPPTKERLPFLRRMLKRLNADVLCLQEVHSQDDDLDALKAVIKGTPYETFCRVHTTTVNNKPFKKRNLVILSKHKILKSEQHRNTLVPAPKYSALSKNGRAPRDISWERPILHALITHPRLGKLNVVNLHMKSRSATNIPNLRVGRYAWKSASGWAEGYFLSSMKRVGQAIESRCLVDSIFDCEKEPKIIVCGDFNAEPGEVPVEAIRGRVENTGNLQLRARVLVPCNGSIPESVRFSYLYQGRRSLLDHMLISQSLLPYWRSSRILNEMLHDESLPFFHDRKFPESDHAPYVSEFASD